jgi:hypothetical protein
METFKYCRRVLTANPIRPFAIEYASYSMVGAVAVAVKAVISNLLKGAILWPHEEQRERK